MSYINIIVVDWIKTHSLSYLAVPKFVASGSHEHGGTKFRFMVMERFGEDIEKKFTSAGRKFSLETVCYLAIQLVSSTSKVYIFISQPMSHTNKSKMQN